MNPKELCGSDNRLQFSSLSISENDHDWLHIYNVKEQEKKEWQKVTGLYKIT